MPFHFHRSLYAALLIAVVLGVGITYFAKAGSLPKRSVLVKTADDPTIYYINAAGFKKPILNEQVFSSYGNHWENVLVISPGEFKTYPNIDGITFAGGDKGVYVVVGNQKRFVVDQVVF